MSDSAHAYELPADQTVPADAVREAVDGEVVYLTRNGSQSLPWLGRRRGVPGSP